MMITRHEGHGSFAKQFLQEGSMGGIMKVNHLHSQHAYSSGENLSPRSVLEQRALSGLAIAIDLEEKMKLSHTQESVILCRFLSKQSIMHMGTQGAKASIGRSLSKASTGRCLSRERLNHEERETLSGVSHVGLKMVISMQQMSNQEGKAHENPRSLARERMNDEEREGIVSGSSNVGASLGGDGKQANVFTSNMKVCSSGDPPLKSLLPSTCRSSCERGQSICWLRGLGHVQQQRFPACASSMEDSIFYYATNPPSTISYHLVDDDDDDDDGFQACSPVVDFLKCCFFCKCRLGVGKDIFMYRGDQAFCSVECRCEQIAKDECMGASAL